MTSSNALKDYDCSLVNITNGQPMTTSLLVAEKFRKRHVSVTRAIRNLECSKQFTEHNFVQSEYIDTTGRANPVHHITKDGFVFLVMGFTGKKAASHKESYIHEFNRIQRLLSRQQSLSWKESREQSREARKAETDAIQRFIDYAFAQGSQNAKMYYMNFTKLTHHALFIKAEMSPIPCRDILNTMQLSFLTSAEYLVGNTILEGMKKGLHYKTIYKLAKDCVDQYADMVGATPLYLPEPDEQTQQYDLPVLAHKPATVSMVSCNGGL